VHARTDAAAGAVGEVVAVVGIGGVDVGSCREGMVFEEAFGLELLGVGPEEGRLVD
jgi:hypothetical protein